MKKALLILLGLFILCSVPVKSAESDDLWGNFNTDITPPKESKFVSDEEFDKALDQMNSKVNKWKTRLQKRNIPKGEEFSQSNETEIINNNQGEKATLPVISLPVELYFEQGTVPVGHYQVKGEMVDGRPVLNFYQASDLIFRLPATETNDDYGKDEILFADWIEEDNNKLKIIYGSLDFNAYAYVNIAQ